VLRQSRLVLLLPIVIFMQTAQADTAAPSSNAALNNAIADAVRATRAEFSDANIKDDAIAVTVIDLRDAGKPVTGSFRGDQPTFPASVVKLFYLAYAQRLLEDGTLADSEELRRGISDMIVDSSNDATSFILDAITDAPNGGLLAPAEMERWAQKRNAVNRFFADLGYEKINVNQKAYCEGPYGRERIFIGPKFENRNKLTTDATATLLAEIAARRFVSSARSETMLALLARDRTKESTDPDDQAHGFIAGGLPPGTKVWSKAGWTSTARHDAAYVESEDESVHAVIVIFTTGVARHREIIPKLGGKLFAALREHGQGRRLQPFVK
jgi:beta-lactamase class A